MRTFYAYVISNKITEKLPQSFGKWNMRTDILTITKNKTYIKNTHTPHTHTHTHKHTYIYIYYIYIYVYIYI